MYGHSSNLERKEGIMNVPTGLSDEEPRADREKAMEVAKLLYGHGRVRDVLLFGSIAKVGIGRDIDLIVIAEKERAKQFITIVDIVLPEKSYTHKRVRQEIAAEVLEGHFDTLLERAKQVAGVDIDIFVFPPDWREHLEAIRAALHAEPKFMQAIVWDAVSLIEPAP
jgi:predicted nucleotidyltransferase